MRESLIREGVYRILEGLDIDINDENFRDTPDRVTRAYREMLRGQDNTSRKSELKKILSASFPTNYKGIVSQRGIMTVGLCPHHMLPIRYFIDIGYIADGKALGLSKLTRILELLSARMVLQETLTQDIVDTFAKELKAKGVIVVVRGDHGCMSFRGVKQPIMTTTSSVFGTFDKDTAARQEFFDLNQ